MNIHSQRKTPADRPESSRRQQFEGDQAPPPDAYDAVEESTFSLSHILQLLWAHKGTLCFTTILCTALAALWVMTEVPRYTASARVVLETQGEKLVDFESVVPQLSREDKAMQTELLSLRSHDLMLRVVERLDLSEEPEFNPALRPPDGWKELVGVKSVMAAIGQAPKPRATPTPEEARTTAAEILRNKVSVSIVPKTYAFEISVETESPTKSADIANTVAELYVDGQRETKFEAMEEASTWLGTRAVELKDELEAAEARVEEFAATAEAVDEETLAANTQRLKTMRARQEELRERARQLRNEAETLEAMHAAGQYRALADAVDNSRVSELARKMAKGEATSADIARLERSTASLVTRHSEEADRADEQAETFDAPIAELAAEVEAQSSDLVTLRQLQREAEATRLVYEHFLGRMKEVSVQQGIQQADSRVLELAKVPGAPSHPQVRATILRGGVLGFVLGLVLVSVRVTLRSTFQMPEELESATGHAVIGVIPEQPVHDPSALLARVVEKPGSAMAEAVRNLRTAVQLSNVDTPPQVIMLTSSVPEEGKTVLAGAMAQTSAMAGKKVLLLEADLRRRRLNKYLGFEHEAGLISMLSGATSFEETVLHDDATNLDILPADEGKVTPVDLFDSDRFRAFLEEARKAYDLVVIDTPPVLAVPDARVIAQNADAVVYVVRWNATTRRMVQAGLDLFAQVNLRVTGLSLTRVNPKRMDRYGYYGYGYGYGRRGIGRYYSE